MNVIDNTATLHWKGPLTIATYRKEDGADIAKPGIYIWLYEASLPCAIYAGMATNLENRLYTHFDCTNSFMYKIFKEGTQGEDIDFPIVRQSPSFLTDRFYNYCQAMQNLENYRKIWKANQRTNIFYSSVAADLPHHCLRQMEYIILEYLFACKNDGGFVLTNLNKPKRPFVEAALNISQIINTGAPEIVKLLGEKLPDRSDRFAWGDGDIEFINPDAK